MAPPATVSKRVLNWPVPFVHTFEKPFSLGQIVTVKGLPTGEKFDILLEGERPLIENTTNVDDVEIFLHVCVCPHEKTIYLNSKRAGHHDYEKQHRIKEVLTGEKPFDITIGALPEKFEIYINQKHEAEYHHKAPLTNVSEMRINGALDLHSVNFGGQYFEVPYKSGLDGIFSVGKSLYISGVPFGQYGFHVNLLNEIIRFGENAHHDIVFHFDVRFDHKYVVRNHRVNGKYGKEEKDGDMPFEADTPFDMIIRNNRDAYQVFVNGQKFCEFAHRTDADAARFVDISGDLELLGAFVF